MKRRRVLACVMASVAVLPAAAHAQPVARPIPVYRPEPPPPPPAPVPPPPPGEELLDEEAAALPELPPPPDAPPAPPPRADAVGAKPVFERPPPVPSRRRLGFHLGTSFGLEVAREGASSFALGAGAQIGLEVFWPQVGFELAASIQAHGDTSAMPDHSFWEAHPIAYLKKPFKSGVWEVFAGYGVSPPSLHAGDFAGDQYIHVVEAGIEDRTTRWYSRLFVRWYAPFDGDLIGAPTVVVAASVGMFRLSQKKSR